MSSDKSGESYARPLKFWAEVIKVQTMESGAIRLTLDLPENETVLMAQLAECKRRGAVLEIKATPKVEEPKIEYGGRLK